MVLRSRRLSSILHSGFSLHCLLHMHWAPFLVCLKLSPSAVLDSRVLCTREIINRLGSTCMQGTADAHAPSGLKRMYAHACNQASSHSPSLTTYEQATLSRSYVQSLRCMRSAASMRMQLRPHTHMCSAHQQACTHPVAHHMVYTDERAMSARTILGTFVAQWTVP